MSFRRKLFRSVQEGSVNIMGANLKIMLLFAFVNICSIQTNAQAIATAKLDSNKILVGQAVHVEVNLKQNRSLTIPWVELPDSIGKLEIIAKSKIDTVSNADSTILERKQTLTVSAYDSGYFVIPPFAFYNNGDTTQKVAETDPLLISVFTVEVDTTKPIRDIRGVIEVPMTWRDYLPWILGVVGGLLLALVGYYFYRKYKNRPIVLLEKKIPTRPAHEIA